MHLLNDLKPVKEGFITFLTYYLFHKAYNICLGIRIQLNIYATLQFKIFYIKQKGHQKYSRHCHSSLQFKKQNLVKFADKIQLQNVLLVNKYFNNILPSIFDNWFTLYSDIHNYNTAASYAGKLFKPSFRTSPYGKFL